MAQTVKNLPAKPDTEVQSLGWIDSPGEGNGYPLWYPCLENPMTRGAWRATVRGVTWIWMWLSDLHFYFSTCINLESVRRGQSVSSLGVRREGGSRVSLWQGGRVGSGGWGARVGSQWGPGNWQRLFLSVDVDQTPPKPFPSIFSHKPHHSTLGHF